MITERTRMVTTWQEAVSILSKNCSVHAQNINVLEKEILRLKKKNKATGLGFLVIAVVCAVVRHNYDSCKDLDNRLTKCEQALLEKCCRD